MPLSPAAAVLITLGWLPAQADARPWLLMGRHGACVEIAEVAHRRPVLSGITTPQALVDRLRRRGEPVRIERLAEEAVTVTAPGERLALIFVREALCRSGPRK
jgi:hypothetical protein